MRLVLLLGCAALVLASRGGVALPQTTGGLSVSAKKCGQKTCPADNYCSQFEVMCRPCANICEASSHNFQEAICTEWCQDYIHDKRYMRKDENGFATIKNDVDKLYIMVIICFILLGTILASIIGIFLFWYLRCRADKMIFEPFKKKETSQNNNKSTDDGPKIGYKSEGLKLEMPVPSVASASRSVSPSHDPVTPATTSTPLSRNRHPSEDATLDYAYDNPAMIPSPVLDVQQLKSHQKRESSF